MAAPCAWHLPLGLSSTLLCLALSSVVPVSTDNHPATTGIPAAQICLPGDGNGLGTSDETSLLQVSLLQTHREVTPSPQGGDVYNYVEMLAERRSVEGLSVHHRARRRHAAMSRNTTEVTVGQAAAMTGVKVNAEGDLMAFFSSLGMASATVAGGLFTSVVVLSRMFPLIFGYFAQPGQSPGPPAPHILGWLGISFRLGIDDVVKESGLDHGMLIEFSLLSMRILLAVGIPSVLILGSLHLFCSGNAAGEDHLSWLGMANVKEGSWVCWVHSAFVWWVVIITQRLIYDAMRAFIPRRMKWLKEMPEPRATTVLMEGIPAGVKNSPEDLKRFYDEHVFGREAVREVHIVKDTTELLSWKKKMEDLQKQINQAKTTKSKSGGRVVSSDIHSLIQAKREAEMQVEKLMEDIDNTNDLNSEHSFVTFKTRRQTTVALKLFSPEDEEEVEVTIPPDPADVIWADLLVDPAAQTLRVIIGYALIGLLFWGFMPIVIGIAAVTRISTLQEKFPFVDNLIQKYPGIATFWDAVMGSIGLTLMLGFMPTFLKLIFEKFFVLKAYAWAQHRLQEMYFYFLVIFVLLVTAIGSSIISTAQQLIDDPMSAFALLATTLPTSTHFYLNYMPVQWATHGISSMRFVQVAKYVVFSRFYTAEEAREMAEPEDQDFDGIGPRSARWTLLLVTSLVFSTLSPLITILGFVNFALCRLIYSYFFVYVETRKADLGGVFWYTMLRHVQQGLFLFITLMTGVLLQRSRFWAPGIISAAAYIFQYFSFRRFHEQFRWEFLDFQECQDVAADAFVRVSSRKTYKQPELPGPDALAKTKPTVGGLQEAMQAFQSRLGFATGSKKAAQPIDTASDHSSRSTLDAGTLPPVSARQDRACC
mmetsp:Transcript_21295/g.45301  ORF Transcript_21295/g.45301 Transcript_21295/m.45301 type:complete len:875 (+) Transcript_21295:134-2758(+)